MQSIHHVVVHTKIETDRPFPCNVHSNACVATVTVEFSLLKVHIGVMTIMKFGVFCKFNYHFTMWYEFLADMEAVMCKVNRGLGARPSQAFLYMQHYLHCCSRILFVIFISALSVRAAKCVPRCTMRAEVANKSACMCVL